MKNYLILFCVLSLTILLWFIGLPEQRWESLNSFWPIRKEIVYCTGVMAYLMMAITVVLSLRLRWIERLFGGLDKVYQFHKWIGIWSGILLFFHWMAYIIPKSLSGAGWLVKPVKQGLQKAAPLFLNHKLANSIAEVCAYLTLILIAIALIRLIPYHWFRRLHKLFPIFFLAITLHSISLMPTNYWFTSGGILLMVVAIVGTLASLFALFGQIGKGNRFQGQVAEVKALSNDHLIVTCQLAKTKMNYQSGHFAFVRFEGTKDPHPFSLISACQEDNCVRFCIKPLGDDTRWMATNLKPGHKATIEGPYGKFDFNDPCEVQVWAAGGVGIAPFLSRLEELDCSPSEKLPTIHFYYCTRDERSLQNYLLDLCERVGVHLHLINRNTSEVLDVDELLDYGIENKLSVWYCGPQKLGDELENAWNMASVQKCKFHRESFEMR